jgi:GAF domain-containing protein
MSDGQAVARPLVVEGQVYGALYYTVALEPVVPALCLVIDMLVAGAVASKSLARETLERYREINLLYEVHETIGASLELDVVVRRMLEESIRIIKADGGSVLLVDDLTDRLVARDSAGFNIAEAERTLIDQALSDKVMSTGKPSVLNDLEPYVLPEAAKDAQLSALLSAPLKSRERVLGVITLGRTRADAEFTAGDLKLLMALASQAGVAIANAREVEARERRLKQRIAELHIEIDEAKKQREVRAITDSEYFDRLREDAKKMRAEFDV